MHPVLRKYLSKVDFSIVLIAILFLAIIFGPYLLSLFNEKEKVDNQGAANLPPLVQNDPLENDLSGVSETDLSSITEENPTTTSEELNAAPDTTITTDNNNHNNPAEFNLPVAYHPTENTEPEHFTIVDEIAPEVEETTQEQVIIDESEAWEESYYEYEDDTIEVDFGDKTTDSNNSSKVVYQAPVWENYDGSIFNSVSNWFDQVTNQNIKSIEFSLISAYDTRNENPDDSFEKAYQPTSVWDEIKHFFALIYQNDPENIILKEEGGRDIVINQSVLQNVNVQYEILPNRGIKEEIEVVNADNLKNAYIFNLKLDDGVKYRRNHDYTVEAPADVYYFYTNNNQYIAHFVPLVAYDSAGAQTDQVTMEIKQIEYDAHQIIVSVDSEWMYDENRSYPIYIDPSIVHDTQTEFNTADSLNRTITTADPSIELTGPPYPSCGVYTSDVIDMGSTNPLLGNLQWTENGVQVGGEDYDLSPAAIGHWKFNETSGTTVSDSSGNGYNATAYNMTTTGQDDDINSGWTDDQKKIGDGAIRFDSSNDYAKTSAIDIGDEFTFSFWMKADRFYDWGDPLSTGNADKYITFLTYADKHMNFYLGNGSTWINGVSTSAGYLTENTWYHIVGTCDGSIVKFYIDGDLIGSAGVSGISYNQSVNFGFRHLPSPYYFDGTLDDARLYDRAISADEVISLYNATNIEFQTRTGTDDNPYDGGWEEWKPAGTGTETQLDAFDNQFLYDDSDSDLILYWPMDEESGTNIDNPVNNDDGTASSSTIVDGKFGKARAFDGSSSILSLNSYSTDSSINSVSMWFKPDVDYNSSSSCKYFTQLRDGGSGDYFYIGLGSCTSSLSNEVIVINHDSTGRTGVPNITLKADEWYKLDFNWNGSVYDIYINGVAQSLIHGTSGSTSAPLLTDPNQIHIGSYSGGGYAFDGVVDEFRLFDANRSAADIANEYIEGIELNSISPCLIQESDSALKTEGSFSSKTTFGQPKVDDNTIALWHLDETGGSGAYLKDSSGNGYDGTPIGTTVMDGINGKARDFNGSDYFDFSSSVAADMGGASAVTVEAWINPNNASDYEQIFYTSVSGENGKFVTFINSSEQFVVGGRSSSTDSYQSVTTTSSLSVGSWTHVVGVIDVANDDIKIYFNGIEQSTTGSPSFSNTTFSSETGSLHRIGYQRSSYHAYYHGSIDEVRVINRELSADEIYESYRLGRDHYLNNTISNVDLSNSSKLAFDVASDRPGENYDVIIGESEFANYQPDENTLGLWHMEEESGSDAYIKDSSSYGNDGTPVNTYADSGKIGAARGFDGSGDYINIPNYDTTFAISGNITVDAWVKKSTSAGGMVLRRGDYATYAVYATDVFQAWYYNSGCGTSTGVTGTSKIDDGQWHYVAFTRNGTTASLYVDGRLEDVNTSGTSSACVYSSEPLRIGAGVDPSKNPNAFMNGSIDEVRISNIARTPEEIRQAYEIGLRTHSITFDFAASLDNANTISGSGDTSFTVDATTKGLSSKGEGLYVGDTIIIKENYDGTEYIAQGVVDAVNATTGAVTVASWNAGSTFPSGGFTQYADAFKWQREYFDLTDVLDDHLNAASLLSIRKTDGDSGSTIWMDDMNSVSSYMSDPSGSTINSSDNRYFQYRAILNTNDNQITPSISDVTVNFFTGVDPSYESVTSSQSSLNNHNQDAFNVQCVGVNVYQSGETVTCQGSWDNSTWNAIGAATSPISGAIIQGTPDVSGWPGYPADGNVNMSVRIFVDGQAYDTKTLNITKDTVVPTFDSIDSVAGDTSDPYLDYTDDGSTIVSMSTTGASSCRWDETDTNYDSMSNTCSSVSSCTLDLTGTEGHIVYIRCIDDNSNNQASSTELKYSIVTLDDWDGIPYGSDNCPLDYNPNQSDKDGDAIGDVCDAETLINSTSTWDAGEYTFKHLHITNNSTITAASNTGLDYMGVLINAEDITIDVGSSITANNQGYPTDQGPGHGTVTSNPWHTNAASGAGHGGKGGRGYDGALSDPGDEYGDTNEPTSLGSGGGSNYGYSGGTGGGAIKLNVSDTLINNGEISSTGANGASLPVLAVSYGGAGGGSGGSIWIVTDTLSGSGNIKANGGSGSIGGGPHNHGGGGSGGRISIDYNEYEFTGTTQAKGGNSNENERGEDGTVSLNHNNSSSCDSGNQFTTCYLNTHHYLPDNNSYQYNNLILESGATLEIKSNYSANVTSSSFEINDGGNIYQNNYSDLTITTTADMDIYGDIVIESGEENNRTTLNLNADNIDVATNSIEGARYSEVNINADDTSTIDSLVMASWVNISGLNTTINTNGQISANYLGYPTDEGTGAGTVSSNPWHTNAASGGGHGGLGGRGYDGALTDPGDIYGNIDEPIALGSGGGSNIGYSGGSGGGAIKIDINGAFIHNGIMSSNGSIGASTYSSNYGGTGGGSGGSIWITADSFTGSGILRANGGAGGNGDAPHNHGGGGSGGRISIDYNNYNFTGTTQVNGGNSEDNERGEDGTITLNNNPTNSCDSGNQLTTCYVNGHHYLPDNISYQYNSLIVESGGIYEFKDNYSESISLDNLTINTGGDILQGNSSDLTIAAVASIDVDGEYYLESGSDSEPTTIYLSGNTINISGNSLEGGQWSEINLESDDTITIDGKVSGTWVNVDTNNINITGTGYITTNALGNLADQGPGFATAPYHSQDAYAGAGAGHGDVGGLGYGCTIANIGASYGSENSPIDLGSGGASHVGYSGGQGGGAVKIVASGATTVNGSITSNAGSGTNVTTNLDGGTGGGSGGSIWIISDSLSGSGDILAEGGNAGQGDSGSMDNHGGCGAGGRIKIEYGVNTFSGDVSVDGGDFGYILPCNPGSIVYAQGESSLPRVDSIIYLENDLTTPFVDTSDNGNTLVRFTTVNQPTNIKWDTIDTDYDNMSNSCSSTTECILDLTGEGLKTVYFRATDGTNKSANSYELQYTIRQALMKNTLSSSQPSETDLTLVINITPDFSEAITDGSIKLIMDEEFDFSGLTVNDVAASGGDVTWTNDEIIYAGGTQIAYKPHWFYDIAYAQGENSITFNFTGNLNSEDGEITFEISGANQPGNPPTEGPYDYIVEWYEQHDAGGSPLYIKDGKVYINENIVVSASIPTAFSFTIASVGSGTVNGATITQSTSVGSAVNFGTYTGSADRIAAHDLIVSSNATGGYQVTVQYTGQLASNSDNMNDFTGSNTTPTTWASPPGSGTESYFGYTTEDGTLSESQTDRFTSSGGNKWAAYTTIPAEVAYHDGPASDQADRVGYRLELTGLQPAGIYTTNLIYIATPTY